MIYDSLNDFTIDTDKIVLAEKEGTIWLTFPIERNYETEKTENLVLKSETNGSYMPFLIEYSFGIEDKEKVENGERVLDLETKTGVKLLNELDIDEIGTTTNSLFTICISVTIASCSYGQHNDDTGYDNCQGYSSEEITICGEYGAPGGGFEGGFGGPNANPSYNNEPGNPSSPSEPNSPGQGGGGSGGNLPDIPNIPPTPIITAPLLILDDEEFEDETPCDELRKFIANNSIQQSLGILKPQSLGPIERGNYISETTNASGANYLSFPIIPYDTNNPTILNMNAGLNGGNVIGAMHCHTDPVSTGGIPMFGHGDLESLYSIAVKHNNGNDPKNYAEYTVMLSVGSGHYALKIKDFSNFYINLQNNYANFKEELKDVYEKSTATANSTKLIEDFLKTLNKNNLGSNVSMYKATESTIGGITKISGWKEQILKADGTKDELPCTK